MEQILSNLFAPYADYTRLNIILELCAVFFSIVSALYSRQNNIKIYPTGIVSTLLFTYLCFEWELFADMLINAYYFVMSCWGWYLWSPAAKEEQAKNIGVTYAKQWLIAAGFFVFGAILSIAIYVALDRFGRWWSYVDILTTAIAFAAMYLLAKRKIENWLLLLAANIISAPLYYIKGYTISSFLYFIFIVISVMGYLSWRKIYQAQQK